MRTNDDIYAELQKITSLLKGMYGDQVHSSNILTNASAISDGTKSVIDLISQEKA